MAPRAASIERLSSVAANAHVGAKTNIKPLHDGGGLYLRRFDSGNWFWYLRATSAVSGKETWTAIHPGIPYPRTSL